MCVKPSTMLSVDCTFIEEADNFAVIVSFVKLRPLIMCVKPSTMLSVDCTFIKINEHL